MNSDYVFVGGSVVFAFLCLACVFGLCAAGEAWQCHGYGAATGVPVKMIALECYAQVDGEWILRDFANERRITVRSAK